MRNPFSRKETEEMQQQQENNIPDTPFQEVPPPAPDQYGPDETERQNDISSPVHEETPKEPKEKQEQKPRGRRTITAEEWEEKSSALTVAAEKYLSAMTVDSVIRKHRAMVTQLRDRGIMDTDIAEMFASVYGLDVDARDIQKAMKPKRKRRKTKDAETENTTENIIAVSPEEEAAEAIAQ